MSNPSSLDPSLWWDPFTSILTDLENAPLSSQLPRHIEKKVKDNHAWFVDTVSLFKPPNSESRQALSSNQVKIGSHELNIKPELKDKALQISSYLALDEVQSYILVERSLESYGLAFDSIVEEYLHVVLLQYYIERQCLLKCTRQLIMHALFLGISSKGENAMRDVAMKLISDGLERKLISVLHDLLSCSPPEEMDVDLSTLWAEEILIEDNLVLDILFLFYYESICSCNGETWKKLCSFYKGILFGSYNFGKLAISNEALKSSYQAKIQLLLILMETLDLENLLQLVHDEIPFRLGASIFSMADIQQMDVLISSFSAYETKETGPLILIWAVYLCLITSLPGAEENNVLTEIDHISYLRQAFESASLSYLLEILDSDLLKESEGPVAGYRSVLRTLVSSFIASYEINLQSEDSTLNLILDILCKIYRGEESLCNQFWDKESFIDGPIRCLLCSLEGEFPFRTAELVRLLSSLSEGSWPTECVFNFLDRSGISSLFEVTSESLVDKISQTVETNLPLHVPGVEGLLIPSKTCGRILKVIGGNTALIRWEYKQSGLLILVLHLSQERCMESNEVLLTLDLLSRMVSFSTAVTYSLMELGNSFYFQDIERNQQLGRNSWVIEIICTVIKNASPSSSGSAVMSMGVGILTKMLKCAPSHVAAVALKSNLFEMNLRMSMYDAGYDGLSSGSWLVSGKLAKMLLIDSEQNDCEKPLTISVLEFTMQLVETGLNNDLVLALVVFSLQYILINHEYWKYKMKHTRWKVTLKVLEMMKTCMMSSLSEKLGVAIRDILLCDSSIHSVIFRLICTTKRTLENLYISRLVELVEIDGFQRAVGYALDILYIMLSRFSEDTSLGLPVFHQALLSSAMKPIPVASAVMSLISFTRYAAIQVGAAKALSMLLIMADNFQPYLSGNMCFDLEDGQIADFRHSVKCILMEGVGWNEDLFVATLNMLTSAARHQPPFLVAVLASKADSEVCVSNAGKLSTSETSNVNLSTSETSNGLPPSKDSSLLDALMHFIEKADVFIDSNANVLLVVLDFLKALWQGAGQYINILECLKSSRLFWKQLSNCISITASLNTSLLENLSKEDVQSLANKHSCQSIILDIMAYEMFLKKKLLHAESLVKETSKLKNSKADAVSTGQTNSSNGNDLKDILSSWRDMSIVGNVIKSCTSCEYDNALSYHAKVAASMFLVHVMGKLDSGEVGSLSASLVEKIRITFVNLSNQPVFSELLAQYSHRGYSEGKELRHLILNDLYYHLQGEIEGRKMGPGPFRELSVYLIESKCLQYQQRYKNECSADGKDIYLYDLITIRRELGLDTWDYTDWKDFKAIAEKMLDCMQRVNSAVMLSNSKLSVLKSLITVLTMFEGNLLETKATTGGQIPDKLCSSCINHICQSIHVKVESLAPVIDASKEVIDCLSTQAELLLHLVRSSRGSLSSPVCAFVLQTSGSGLKVLTNVQSCNSGVRKTMKVLLMLLLLVLEFSKIPDKESEGFAEISNICLSLLPILCECITTEHCDLSLTTIDLILGGFLAPNTWFRIIQKHLQLQHVILKLHEKVSSSSISIKLKFLLTLARVREGAEMLLSAGFLSSLQILFGNLLDARPPTINNKSSEKDDKPQPIWGLGLAVITAMVRSLKDSSCVHIMENVIPYLFSEKAHLVSYYIDAPDLPSDDHDKKRPRAQRTLTSLNALKETEHTLMLICTLAKHWNFWVKAMKEVDSQLRERSIHLLAFISRGIHHVGESTSRMAPLLYTPISKEEFELCKKPSFVNSKNGWFGLSPICCTSKSKPSNVSGTSTAIVIKSQSTETASPVSPTFFSDLVGLQMYRIAFLLLKFLCLEAEGFVRRSEEVGFIDLAHIPELPMPEILHGLQDQSIAVVSELCNTDKSKQIHPEIQEVCLMLLQIMEMALYLELCVLQICGMRTVLGRVEDFSKEVQLLLKATEGHAFLGASMKSLKHIISLVYPGLLQSEGFL